MTTRKTRLVPWLTNGEQSKTPGFYVYDDAARDLLGIVYRCADQRWRTSRHEPLHEGYAQRADAVLAVIEIVALDALLH